MIAKVVCFITIRVPKFGAQLHTKGHAINLVNKVTSICNKLPRAPNDTGIVIVRPPSGGVLSGISEFVARPDKVRAALVWLKTHNPLYADVELDEDVLRSLQDPTQQNLVEIEVPEADLPQFAATHQDVEEVDPLGVRIYYSVLFLTNYSPH